MNASPQTLHLQTLQRQGIDSLRRGEPLAARQLFEQAALAAPGDATVQLGLAYACTALNDHPAALVAVDAALRADPRMLRALLLKGDLMAATADERAAAAFYQAALQVLPADAQLPADLGLAVQRARQALEQLSNRFEGLIRGRLAASPASQRPRSARFEQSLDLLVGKQQLYLQAPKLYCLPGLPHIAFFERQLFPWMDALEAQTVAIREELLALLQQPDRFAPYLERDAARPVLNDAGLLDNADWSACYLWRNGAPVEPNASRCPRTLAALADLPMPRIPGRAPNILFSQLKPGAHIPPHNGFVNTRLIVHLPLVVPSGCFFRVGNETREWQAGKAWAFDDTIEHEARNTSGQTRVVLLFEIWRPELSEDERAQVSALFEAIGQDQGDWGV